MSTFDWIQVVAGALGLGAGLGFFLGFWVAKGFQRQEGPGSDKPAPITKDAVDGAVDYMLTREV